MPLLPPSDWSSPEAALQFWVLAHGVTSEVSHTVMGAKLKEHNVVKGWSDST